MKKMRIQRAAFLRGDEAVQETLRREGTSWNARDPISARVPCRGDAMIEGAYLCTVPIRKPERIEKQPVVTIAV